MGNNNSCIPWKFFDYDALYLGKPFSNTKKLIYKNCPKGFYVYAEPKKFKNLKSGIEYVTRYCGRVPISENRIVDYDGVKVRKQLLKYEFSISMSFHRNPFDCPKCGTKLDFVLCIE